MGAFVTYLFRQKLSRHFFVLAPNLTIYNKLIADFTPNTAKYVFKGIAEFAVDAPAVITGDNYESQAGGLFRGSNSIIIGAIKGNTNQAHVLQGKLGNTLDDLQVPNATNNSSRKYVISRQILKPPHHAIAANTVKTKKADVA